MGKGRRNAGSTRQVVPEQCVCGATFPKRKNVCSRCGATKEDVRRYVFGEDDGRKPWVNPFNELADEYSKEPNDGE